MKLITKDLITQCVYCDRVREHEEWHHMAGASDGASRERISHGICPGCYQEQLNQMKNVRLIQETG